MRSIEWPPDEELLTPAAAELLGRPVTNKADDPTMSNGPRLWTNTLEEFLSLELPPRELVLSPWLPTQGLAMVYAARGVGKTHFALNCLYTIACGGQFLRFRAPKARRVVYIDAEMPAPMLQQRLAAIVASADEQPAPGFFRTFSADRCRYAPDVTTLTGQQQLEDLIGDAEVLGLDNLSTLCRTGIENEAQSWAPVQEWLLSLRRQGKTVALVHHAGRNGLARGTTKREDVLDEVVRLKHPEDYNDAQGARFEIRFEKRRGLLGADAEPFEAMLTSDPAGRGVWAIKSIQEREAEKVATLIGAGMTQREVAAQLGVSLGKVNSLARQARESGVVDAR